MRKTLHTNQCKGGVSSYTYIRR